MYSSDVISRINSEIDYYRQNPKSDPNMYSFVVLSHDVVNDHLFEYANYGLLETYEYDAKKRELFSVLSNIVKTKLLGNNLGITEASLLYQLYDFAAKLPNYGKYSVSPEVELLASLGEVSLRIYQEKRDHLNGFTEEVNKLSRIKSLAECCPHILYQDEVNRYKPTFVKYLIDEVTMTINKSTLEKPKALIKVHK